MSWFSMRIDRAISAVVVVCAVLVVSGCGVVNYFPTFDEARAQTHAEMRKIVARIPVEAFRGLVDILPNSSFACDKKTAQYTGYWEEYVADTFDIFAWLDTLRSQLLREGYRDEGYRPGQSVAFRSPGNNLLIAAIETTTIPDVHGSRFAAFPVVLRIFPPPRPRKSRRLPSARPRFPPGSILHLTNQLLDNILKKQRPGHPPIPSKNPSKMSAVTPHQGEGIL